MRYTLYATYVVRSGLYTVRSTRHVVRYMLYCIVFYGIQCAVHDLRYMRYLRFPRIAHNVYRIAYDVDRVAYATYRVSAKA